MKSAKITFAALAFMALTTYSHAQSLEELGRQDAALLAAQTKTAHDHVGYCKEKYSASQEDNEILKMIYGDSFVDCESPSNRCWVKLEKFIDTHPMTARKLLKDQQALLLGASKENCPIYDIYGKDEPLHREVSTKSGRYDELLWSKGFNKINGEIAKAKGTQTTP